jgi:NADH dehydrogenase
MGEAAVRELVPPACIVKPSIVFGQGDGFFNKFGQLMTISPVLPLIGGGTTRFQPVFVGDVGAAVCACVLDPATGGQTYELIGPATYTFRQLMEITARETLRSPLLLPLPFPLARIVGAIASLSPFPPLITADQVDLLRADKAVGTGAPGLAELGVAPTALEAILPTYLYRFRPGGQYAGSTAPA